MNEMMLDVLAAVARKDYDDWRRRQAQGIATAKAAGKYRGRPEDKERNAVVLELLREGKSWAKVMRLAKCSRSTVAKGAKRLADEKAA